MFNINEVESTMSDEDFRKLFPESFSSSRKKFNRNYRINGRESREIGRLFEKKFHFTNDKQWCMPKIEVMFRDNVWKIEEFQAAKKELNAVKSKLNDFDLEDWHNHTRTKSKSGDILWKLKNEYDPEFVTRAWCKFYEILMTFPIISEKVVQSKILKSVHLCEAPGAFITSLNHYLHLHYTDTEWDWRASTLNPYYEGNTLSSMVNDDRFIFQTLSNWTFGCDFTGNIMNLDNINHIIEDVKHLGEISLVTADGSVDCQDNPAEQELDVSLLQYCETIAALSILGEGGSFLLKIFTSYEAQTVCLLYLLCCAFTQVNIFKPVTSKEGNSEVYVVCLNYKGRNHLDPWLEKMKCFIESEWKENVMFPMECIPEDFIEQLTSCSTIFKNFQIEAIENNIETHSSDNYNIKRLKYLTAQHFMKHYQLEKLPDKRKTVVGKLRLNETVCLNLDGPFRKGSFSNKIQEKDSSVRDKLFALHNVLQDLNINWSACCNIKWLRLQSSEPEFNVIIGNAVSVVHSSKFCSSHLLKIWSNFREITAQRVGPDCRNKCPLSEPLSKCSSGRLKFDFGNENVKVIRIKADYWCALNHNDNESAEKVAFNEILDAVNKMKKGENLILDGYPLLTQFNVGFIYVLTSCFEKIGFVNPLKQEYSIIFFGFQVENDKTSRSLRFLNEVREKCVEYKKRENKKSVLAIVAITKLCGRQKLSDTSVEPSKKCLKIENEIEEIETGSTFCCCVTEMNNILVKDRISAFLSNLLPTR